MKLHGGHNVHLAGRPSSEVRVLPIPERLFVPLSGARLSFRDIRVEDGARVARGDVLAVDPDSHSVPLVAPFGGTVRLGEVEGHILMESLDAGSAASGVAGRAGEPASAGDGPLAERRKRLVRLGAWHYVRDAFTGRVADPAGRPGAVIVSTIHLEPFLARGDVQLSDNVDSFVRGLEHIQGFLEYERVFLVVPDVRSALARTLRESVRGRAWVRLVSVPLRYPFDSFPILARHLRIEPDPHRRPWGIPSEGVFAIDRALTHSEPCTEFVISVAGPAVEEPVHMKAVAGYPVADILEGRTSGGSLRVVDGGILTGREIGVDRSGVPLDCRGLTVLGELGERRLLAFARPGLSTHAYGRTFFGSWCPPPVERLDTGLRGELRACIACGQCVDVCPARIMPNVIHKSLYRNDLERAIDARIDLCVDCGLCSYVCPSKIELRQEILDAKATIHAELVELEELEEAAA